MTQVSAVRFQTTVLIPLRYVYPECAVLTKEHPEMYLMHCMRNDTCSVNSGCMDLLAKRVHILFDTVFPDARQVIAYFKYRDTEALRAVVFSSDVEDPRMINVNPYGLRKFLREGEVVTWEPSVDYWARSQDIGIIPAAKLVRID